MSAHIRFFKLPFSHGLGFEKPEVFVQTLEDYFSDIYVSRAWLASYYQVNEHKLEKYILLIYYIILLLYTYVYIYYLFFQ